MHVQTQMLLLSQCELQYPIAKQCVKHARPWVTPSMLQVTRFCRPGTATSRPRIVAAAGVVVVEEGWVSGTCGLVIRNLVLCVFDGMG
jgi:hypothetical protein